ncbi:MAG: histidine kinase N-terminal domain-containing protein [Actinobacteria bacterium]|nr:histidine kinase N-terminal domain-containing protein [Actinomycetota bacterium]
MQLASQYHKIANLSNQQIKKIESVRKNIQLIADLSYSDIVIYCLVERGGVIAIAAAKPNTSISVRPDNIVGQVSKNPPEAVEKTFITGKRVEEKSGEFNDVPVKIRAIPIKEDDRVIAVMTSERRSPDDWRPSEMEQMYMGAADDLIQMMEAGVDVGIDFPPSKEAGDGLIRVDPNGIITYASPNAVTIYRRLGVEDALTGQSIYKIGLNETPVSSALEGRKAIRLEVTEKGMTVVKRAIPLIEKDRVKGVVAIIRDITDVRAREQQLKIKEATIREIHHRVKNNLQTIASLLRLQSRRMTSPEARQALMESVGRISSIAVVHEILSQSSSGILDFKEIAANINKVVQSGLVQPDKKVIIVTRGTSGRIPSPMATALALILTELVQNAIEHAFGDRKTGKITIMLKRRGNMLIMIVSDNGIGLPNDFDVSRNSNLGLQIVHTLVSDELGGSWEMKSSGGTRVAVRVPVDQAQLYRSAKEQGWHG